MNKTSLVLRTVLATLCVEAVIALIAVLWITGGEFGPMIRKADYMRRVNKIYDLGTGVTYEGGKFVTSSASAVSDEPEWKLEYGPYKEWIKTVEITKGDKATVPDWGWVTVKNPNPVSSGNDSVAYGDSCGIQRGGTVTAMGIEGNRLLVRYSIGGTQYGTSCPSGVLFFTNKETFSKMIAEYQRVRNAEQREKKLVKRLLGK